MIARDDNESSEETPRREGFSISNEDSCYSLDANDEEEECESDSAAARIPYRIENNNVIFENNAPPPSAFRKIREQLKD